MVPDAAVLLHCCMLEVLQYTGTVAAAGRSRWPPQAWTEQQPYAHRVEEMHSSLLTRLNCFAYATFRFPRTGSQFQRVLQ